MANKHIDILLRAKDQASAVVKSVMGTIGKSASAAGRLVGSLGQSIESIGGKAGKVASSVGRMVAALATMGPIGAAIAGVGFAIEMLSRNTRKAAEAAKEAFDKMAKEISACLDVVARGWNEAVGAITRATSKYNDAAAKVKELTLAEIELQKQRNIAAGMSEEDAAAIAAGQSAKVAMEAEEKKLKKLIESKRKEVDAARDAEEKITDNLERAIAQRKWYEEEYAKQRDAYVHSNSKREGIQYTGVNGQYTVITADEAAASRAAAAQEFDESEDAKVLKERIAKLGESADAARAELKKINQSISAAGDAISNAEKGIETVAKRRTALEVEELNKRAAAERKTAEERIAQKKKLALADIELEKQRSISGGMSSEEASGIAAEKAAMVEIAAEEERLQAARDELAKRRAAAEKNTLAGIAAEEEKLQAETEALAKRRAEAEAAAGGDRASAAQAALAEIAAEEQRLQAETAALAKRRAQAEAEADRNRSEAVQSTLAAIAAEEDDLAAKTAALAKRRAEAEAAAGGDRASAAQAALAEIAAEEQRLQAETAALAKRRAQAESDEASGRAEAEKTVLAGIAAEEEKLQAETEALAKRRAAAEAEAQNRRVAAEKKAAQEKAEIDKRSAAEQARRDRAQLTERIHAVQEANKKELDEIDKKIAAERQKAAEWDRKAQKARDAAQGGGAGFSDWQRAERGGGKEERRARRQQEAAERRARDTIRDLERRERQQRGGLTADQQQRLDAARRFIAMQDPKNNPAAKKAEEIEKQRLAAIKKTSDEVVKLRQAIEQRTVI